MRLQALAAALLWSGTACARSNGPVDISSEKPKPNPNYMVDNQHNYFKNAPDKGTQNGPVWLDSGSFDNFTANGGAAFNFGNSTSPKYRNRTSANPKPASAAASSYWLPQLAPKGKQPYAKGDYKVFRNVVDDFHADNTGSKDATEAINAAIMDGSRCGEECGNTFTQGAIIYFPAGTYKICRPIVQLYFTQFIGDPHDRPIIKGCDEFQGIALVDTDPYIPGGGGQNWYINQNQFFRQIRNFVFDLTDMPLSTNDHDQALVPTGLHWQVSQACSLQNLLFKMPSAKDNSNVTHVGIFMENGSGGFVSDLEFEGGSIGWRAGSQQYTAMNIKFRGCLTAVQMVWDWGFNWQRIDIADSAVAFNISGHGGDSGQGIGSVSIIDSKIVNCPIGILTNSRKDGINGAPNIVLDNLEMSGVGSTVKDEGGAVILAGASHVDLWAIGSRYNGTKGDHTSGNVQAPKISSSLLDSGKLFYRARPQYETAGLDKFLVATDEGCKNDGTGDNAAAINTFLAKAKDQGKIAFFPAGIYRVGSTVVIPTGSVVQGSIWSQIQGAGFYFNDIYNPKVVVQVGNKGDVGTMEIVEMIFSVQGATAGAIVLEWNVHESSQGAACMWDSHVRVGGGIGTGLDAETCPRHEFNDNCICASLLFHVTSKASGYFENVWVWLADHDNDMSVYDEPDKQANQISLYAARGTLIESQGPSWFYGTGSEHAVLYQYQLYNAKNVYLGHIQSETPYYQPNPAPPLPFSVGRPFPGDPDFSHCQTDNCRAAWGLRIIDSEGITLHSAGLYSFFQDYLQGCVDDHNCQDRICEVKGSKGVVLYNVFTVGTVEAVSGINNGSIPQNETQSGFTTEISVWIPLEGDDDLHVCYFGTEIFETPSVTCSPPCILVFPTSHLSSATVVEPGKYTTSLEYGSLGTSTLENGAVVTTFITTTTTVTLDLPKVTTDGIPYYNVNATSGQTTSSITLYPSIPLPPVPVPLPDGQGGTTTRMVEVPPWPAVRDGPPDSPGGSGPNQGGNGNAPGMFHTPYLTTLTASQATVTTITFPATVSATTFRCPPDEYLTFRTPNTVIQPTCDGKLSTIAFACPSTKIVTFLGPSVAVFTADCTLSTVFATSTSTPTTTHDTTTTPPPVWGTWPGGDIEPVTTPVPSKTTSDGVVIVPCHVWFFNFCPGDIKGWKLNLPTGTIGPGPPPPNVVQGWRVEPHWPPWPKITIHPGPSAEYEDKPDDCEPETAKACTDITTLSTSGSGPSATTTTIATTSCTSVTGCSLTDEYTSSTTSTRTDCPSPTPSVAPPRGCPANAIVLPTDVQNFNGIRSALSVDYAGKYKEVGGDGYVLFWWVPLLDGLTLTELSQRSDVDDAYYYEEYNSNVGGPIDNPSRQAPREVDEEFQIRPDPGVRLNVDSKDDDFGKANTTGGEIIKHEARADDPLDKFASRFWTPSLVSTPRNPDGPSEWPSKWDTRSKSDERYLYRYAEPAGKGQWVYVIREHQVYTAHNEFKGKDVQTVDPSVAFGNQTHADPIPIEVDHGTVVTSKVVGDKLGICKECTVRVMTPYRHNNNQDVYVDVILMLNDVLKDVKSKKLQGKAVINMSFDYDPAKARHSTYTAVHKVLKMLDAENVVIVTSAGNQAKTKEGRNISRFPAKYGRPNGVPRIDNIIVVGATDIFGRQADFSQYADWLTTSAVGQNAWSALEGDRSNPDNYGYARGTSYAAPQVAGLVAYLRSLDSDWKTALMEPKNVKKMIQILHRPINAKNAGKEDTGAAKLKMIWNGQVGDKSCLVDYATRSEWDVDKACPDIKEKLDDQTCDKNPNAKRHAYENHSLQARDGGGSCPIQVDDGTPQKTVTYTSGAKPSPTCASGNCGGSLCTGFFCVPNPTGVPPSYHDPKDPNHDSSGGGDTLCQINAGCKDFQCPQGQSGRCSGGHCVCKDGDPPTGQECLHQQDCVSFSCPDGQIGTCDQGYCKCKPAGTNNGKQVRIFFDSETTTDTVGSIYIHTYWSWFAVTSDHTLELCLETPAYKEEDKSGPNPNKVGYPPTMTSDRDIWGHKNCKYSGNADGPGSIECDGVATSKCVKASDYGKPYSCTGDGIDDDIRPKVVCNLLEK